MIIYSKVSHHYLYLKVLVVITGDVSSGKSKILERFVYNRFGEKTQPTIGVEFIPKNITLTDGVKVRL